MTTYEEYVSYNPVLARRCFAAIVDYFIFFGIVAIYMALFGENKGGGTYTIKIFSIHTPILIAIWMSLFPIYEAINGYTLGKGLFDLKVLLDNKKDSRFFASFKRHLLDPIDILFTFGILAVLLAQFTSRHKRLGDMFAETTVVRDDS